MNGFFETKKRNEKLTLCCVQCMRMPTMFRHYESKAEKFSWYPHTSGKLFDWRAERFFFCARALNVLANVIFISVCVRVSIHRFQCVRLLRQSAHDMPWYEMGMRTSETSLVTRTKQKTHTVENRELIFHWCSESEDERMKRTNCDCFGWKLNGKVVQLNVLACARVYVFV